MICGPWGGDGGDGPLGSHRRHSRRRRRTNDQNLVPGLASDGARSDRLENVAKVGRPKLGVLQVQDEADLVLVGTTLAPDRLGR